MDARAKYTTTTTGAHPLDHNWSHDIWSHGALFAQIHPEHRLIVIDANAHRMGPNEARKFAHWLLLQAETLHD